MKKKLFYIFLLVPCFTPTLQHTSNNNYLIADKSEVTAVQVAKLEKPKSVEALRAIIRASKKPISVVGAGYSQGGQTAYPCSTAVDMQHFNSIVDLDVVNKKITVESGALWRDVQKYIDPHNLSVRVMQSYNDFSVGGSLSVNVHGRFMHDGSIIETVESMRVMLADGSIVTASRDENADLFSAVIGGYGACGIILDATLRLTDNIKMERRTVWIDFQDYRDFFNKNILNNPDAVLHNADLYPNEFNRVHSVTFYKTDKEVTVSARLQPDTLFFSKQMVGEQFIRRVPFAKKIRSFFEPVKMAKNDVVWRNYEMSYTVKSLDPITRFFSINILQEYFIPVDQLEHFIVKFRKTVKRNNINVLNLSLRYVHKNTESLLSYAPENAFACVLYINIFNTQAARKHTQVWTRELIDDALSCGGTYYLPYQLHATPQQLRKSYPQFDEFLAVKSKYDALSTFSNSFFKQYAAL